MTHACKNITFARFAKRAVIINNFLTVNVFSDIPAVLNIRFLYVFFQNLMGTAVSPTPVSMVAALMVYLDTIALVILVT